MYNVRYAPWDHYPKSLSISEVQDPLIPLRDFFNSDSVKQHKKELKTWRHFVINEGFYQGDKHGPGELLFLHELNIKLLEGAYLLLLIYFDKRWTSKAVDDEQLKKEKNNWTYYPKNLPDKYLSNPYLALKKIFKKIKPQAYRDYLNMWLSDALHVNPTDEVTEPVEIINVYDSLLLLYDVCWIIYQRQGIDPYLKDKYGIVAKMEKLSKRMVIKDLFPAPLLNDQALIEKLIAFITERFSMIDMICYLGKSSNPDTIYLVLIRNDEDPIEDGELGNKIEDHCKHLTNVVAIIHRFKTVISGLGNGARFWTNLIAKATVLFQRDRNIILPAPQEISNATMIERAKSQWKRFGLQGKQFTKSAEHFINRQDYIQTAFMLNQAAKHFLKASIQSVLGYRVQAHNLSRIVKMTLLFTDDIRAVFKLDNVKSAQLFNFIKEAGQLAQYQENYNPDEEAVVKSLKLIKRLSLAAEAVYFRFVKDLKNTSGS